jgi:hypothetical protein
MTRERQEYRHSERVLNESSRRPRMRDEVNAEGIPSGESGQREDESKNEDCVTNANAQSRPFAPFRVIKKKQE